MHDAVQIIVQGELGANAILAVSIAALKAGAAEKEACFVKLNISEIEF